MAIYKLLLPKMGESVAEATVIKWNKNPGDHIEADETVMEIATDKVDSDVPSPVSGKLTEQFFQVNDIVQVGSVIATIETAGNDNDGGVPKKEANDTAAVEQAIATQNPPEETIPVALMPAQEPSINPPLIEKQQVFEEQHKIFSTQVPFVPKPKDERSGTSLNTPRFYSPLVKNIAAQEGIGNQELDNIAGTGAEGRLTKDDLLAYIQNKLQQVDENTADDTAASMPVTGSVSGGTGKLSGSIPTQTIEQQPAVGEQRFVDQPALSETIAGTPVAEQSSKDEGIEPVAYSDANRKLPEPEIKPQEPETVPENIFATRGSDNDKIKEAQPAAKSLSAGDEIIEMDRMRRLIADHMLTSKQTSPHVTSFVEADVTNLVLWREKVKGNFEKREGQKITYMPLFIEAVVRAIKDMPMINVTVNGTQIIKKKDINISMAAALPSGNLIVPVIKRADELSLVGLTKAVNDLAGRARANKLKPDDVQEGTFTITNIGSFGNIMGTPIINQPQVAILAVGAIKKKVAVIETPEGDLIGIRHMMYLSLSYDHRVVDGALGGSFIKRWPITWRAGIVREAYRGVSSSKCKDKKSVSCLDT